MQAAEGYPLSRWRGLYLASGIAGLVAGAVTLAIVILPYFYGQPPSFEARLELHNNPWYLLRLWLSFLNIFAILLAALGLAVHRAHYAPGAALSGLLFLLFYGATELIGRSVMIFTREYRWVHAAQSAEGEARTAILELIRTFDATWAGAFPLILITFSLSAFLFAWSLRDGTGLQRVACWAMFAASALGAVTFLAPYVSGLRPIASYGYVIIQPGSRVLVGLFLLGAARSTPRP
ncbi:MAG: hypothetical protein AAF417_11670 [Pseudomonadota bacterium]